jgi:hypothetical protein
MRAVLRKITLAHPLAVIHYDIRSADPVPAKRPPDLRSIAYLIERDRPALSLPNPEIAAKARDLFSAWDRLVRKAAARINSVSEDVITEAIIASIEDLTITDAERPTGREFPVLWDDPLVAQLIDLLERMDHALTVLGTLKDHEKLPSNAVKLMRGRLVRPIQYAFAQIAASSRRFRAEISADRVPA